MERAVNGEKMNSGGAKKEETPSNQQPRILVSPSHSSSSSSSTPAERTPLNVVVIGHVDAGKSTLVGHLLVDLEQVGQRQLNKLKEQSKQRGKESFAFAWILDEAEDERERGVTIDSGVQFFSTETKNVSIIDSPGHKELIRNMLWGAMQADVALLVIDASNYSVGIDKGGQTREHLQLVRSLGISKLIVAVNKLDVIEWNQAVYEQIKSRLNSFITGAEVNFRSESVVYVPVSGLKGINLVTASSVAATTETAAATASSSSSSSSSDFSESQFNFSGTESQQTWWSAGPSLVAVLDAVKPKLISRSLREDELKFCVTDVLIAKDHSVTVAGKVESGVFKSGQSVLVLPANQTASVKSMRVRNSPASQCAAGELVQEAVLHFNKACSSVQQGAVLLLSGTAGAAGTDGTNRSSVMVVQSVHVQVVVFGAVEAENSLFEGQEIVAYIHSTEQAAVIKKLVCLVDKSTGKPTEKTTSRRLQCVTAGHIAVIRLGLAEKTAVDFYNADSSSSNTSLCRVVLRDKGQTVAAGVVIQPLASSSAPTQQQQH